MTVLHKSYHWWREHGETWPREIARRLTREPYYHIQQILLADALSRCAPARVLEFGCGFGRHLAYLGDIPGLTVCGVDQSAAMLAGVRPGVGETGARPRLVRNDPLAGLPFKDKAFDITFTVNVLLHVPPEDIARVMAELVRVTARRILHFEPAAGAALDRQAHDGCFGHDYRALYARAGVARVRVEPYCRVQEAVVVDLERPDAPLPWPEALLRVLRQMDAAMESGGGAQAQASPRPQPAGELREAAATADALRLRLDAVLASRTWRWGIRLARSPLGRMADNLLRAFGK